MASSNLPGGPFAEAGAGLHRKGRVEGVDGRRLIDGDT